MARVLTLMLTLMLTLSAFLLLTAWSWAAGEPLAGDDGVAAAREALVRAHANARELEAAGAAARRAAEAARGLLQQLHASAGQEVAARESTWLRVLMVTHARPGGANYLRPTLDALLAQLPPADPFRRLVDVLVVSTDARPAEHAAFVDARAEFAGEPLVRFAEVGAARRFGLTPSKDKKVKASVQQQTADLVEALSRAEDAGAVGGGVGGGSEAGPDAADGGARTLAAAERAHGAAGALPPAELVVAMEDDWLLCPSGLLALAHLVRRASELDGADGRWIALRASYGFNGILLRAADLPSLRQHLAMHFQRRPPDHLVFEWFSGEWHRRQGLPGRAYAEGRAYRTYRWNVFVHVGHVSTLGQPPNRHTPRCYELLYDWLLPAETFKRDECPADDVWPCEPHAPAAGSGPEGGVRGVGGARYFGAPFARVEWAEGLRAADGSKVPAGEPRKQAVLAAGRARVRGQVAAAAGGGGGGGAAEAAWTLVAAARDESCDAACARREGGGACAEAALPTVNTCEALGSVFACAKCSNSNGPDQPARVEDDAPAAALPGHCLLNTGTPAPVFTCAGHHELTRRLCPCAPPPPPVVQINR